MAQRAGDIPIAVTQELTALRMEHATLLGQHQSLSATLAAREEEGRSMEQRLSHSQDEISNLKFRLQNSEATVARAERKAKSAQQEVEVLNSLLVFPHLSLLEHST
jgi:mitotic spindle assembly checkpoint protein MAD1